MDESGGEGAALALLAPLQLRWRQHPSLDLEASMEGVRALVDARVTDVLVQLGVSGSAAGAHEMYSELAAAFHAARGE